MKKFIKKFTALAVALSVLPVADMNVKAEDYAVRDPFYNFEKGYNYYESEHFQFIWGNSGDSSKVTQEFLTENSKNFEACWDVYMNDLSMREPSEAVDENLRDGKKYKTNIYISGTGLENMVDDWAYMSYDSGGFAYMFCCVDSMQYNPPSWVFPHEFGHVMTAHQGGWNNNKYSYAWWEAIGNWYREQYLYSDYSIDETGHGTDFFETYMKNLCFTFPCGRDYYASWAFFQYLTENPDNLDGYGADFVKKLLQEGQTDEYPFDQIERLAPADLKKTLGLYAGHIAGLDFKNGDAYRARLNELLDSGSWNWQQIYTMLEEVSGKANTYAVPTERAPQFAGINVIPIQSESGERSVTLNAGTNIDGADWRACIVQQSADGSCKYSELFSAGETITWYSTGGTEYLAVVATPDLDKITKCGLPEIYNDNSEFSESNVSFSSKERYPYSVTFSDGVSMVSRTVKNSEWESYHTHSNGGGLVSDSANVADSVYVGKNAKVMGRATVSGNARIEDYAVVQDSATVKDNAVISGYAIVAENAVISGNARVDDTGLVMGTAQVSGNAKVIESACVYGNTKMSENAIAKGNAFVMADGVISGQGAVDGDYYDDSGKTISKGTSYGWTSTQSYADSRPYTDKLIYAYDFDSDSSLIFDDRYSSTYGMNYGAEWESERTSAKGVLTFSGNNFADVDRSVLYTEDIDIQTAMLNRGNGTVLFFGDDNSHIKLTADGNNLTAEFTLDGKSEKLTVENAVDGAKWAKVRLVLDGDKGKIMVDGKPVAEGEITINPDDIASTVENGAYRIGADNNGMNNFNGSVDFVRIFSSEAEEPTETYSGVEDVQVSVLVGDVYSDMRIDSFDLVRIRQIVVNNESLASKEKATADVNGDGTVSIADAVTMQNYLLGRVNEFPAGTIAYY
ncbi:MAG: DUF6055 domain-containing protein [Ruminococcus flavefaciens]|nr:DUF6055 domain-containing protein [Ruminococcus flavefaciens]